MRLLLFVLLICSIGTALAEEGSGEKEGSSSWPLWVLLPACATTVGLCALYCGLTIGLCGLDTVNLEIIADAGPEPERTYAQRILPVRRLGHQLLATLLVGNMLMMVLTSQLVAAIVNGGELVNFIVSTLITLIFSEILPMSYCNNYPLLAGSVCIPAVKVSLLVLYVVAKPLGVMLDCMVGHDPGQMYDRNEFRRLIHMYAEKFSDKTGIDTLQMNMMLSALEMNEVTIKDILTPINITFMLEADQVMDAALQRQLWEYGKSRIPVYEKERENIVGVLYVRDLISVSFLNLNTSGSLITVRQFLEKHPRDIRVVPSNTLLQEALTIFKSGNRQFLFVEEAGDEENLPAATAAITESAHSKGADDADHEKHPKHHPQRQKETQDEQEAERRSRVLVLTPAELTAGVRIKDVKIVGVVTMEDVIEKLIVSEIYDEDDFTGGDGDDVGSPTSGPSLREPAEKPRVNFYSYSVASGFIPMSEDQKWALAYYLANTFVLFASWQVSYIKCLVDHVGERYVEESSPDAEIYTSGVQSNRFTLILSGAVKVTFSTGAKISSELRSFTPLGESIIDGKKSFVSDFTARVSQPSRLFHITPDDIIAVEKNINAHRAKRMKQPVKLANFVSSRPAKKTEDPRVAVK